MTFTEYRSYFTMSQESGYLSINLLEMPEEVLNNNEFIILHLEASKTNAISGHTTIVLNIVKTTEIQIVQLLFEQAYYLGEYSKQNGFLFSHVMRLKQGFDGSVTFDLEGGKWYFIKMMSMVLLKFHSYLFKKSLQMTLNGLY